MIVTIDGPAGAGKSSVARRLAQSLGFDFLDTGAMYRAVAWAVCRAEVPVGEPLEIVRIASAISINFEGERVLVNGEDVTHAIRTPEVTEYIKHAAGNERVREILTERQREIGSQAGDLVTEGRDQGTVVFPGAKCKIFLTATPQERAKRRYQELIASGLDITLSEVLDGQNKRDDEDSRRRVGPLAKAPDAVEVVTDGMSPDEVLEHLVGIVRSSQGT